jgi:predicted RNase H-like HicB family nuclease/uncharacterized damage-inducible protein DinB
LWLTEIHVMAEYALYLESGPRKQKTMAHVLDLLGCIAQGATTSDAIAAAPEAIRTYLRFLNRHGETVDLEKEITTRVAEHVMEGPWLGNGDPYPGFAPDFQPLSRDELGVFLHRLAWLHDDLLRLTRGLTPEQLLARPASGGRPISRILEHVAASHAGYLNAALGSVDGLRDAVRAVELFPEVQPAALTRVWQISLNRLEAMTAAELNQRIQRGQKTWTARRMLRRMLEHGWEHLLEISRRVEVNLAR